jgi:hypothetical protein
VNCSARNQNRPKILKTILRSTLRTASFPTPPPPPPPVPTAPSFPAGVTYEHGQRAAPALREHRTMIALRRQIERADASCRTNERTNDDDRSRQTIQLTKDVLCWWQIRIGVRHMRCAMSGICIALYCSAVVHFKRRTKTTNDERRETVEMTHRSCVRLTMISSSSAWTCVKPISNIDQTRPNE